jgi:hypothetical protein
MPNSSICTYEKSPNVTFKMLRIAENEWQIAAECPGTETLYIRGLNSKADVDEWLAGTRRSPGPSAGGCSTDNQQFVSLAGRGSYLCACNNAWRLRP